MGVDDTSSSHDLTISLHFLSPFFYPCQFHDMESLFIARYFPEAYHFLSATQKEYSFIHTHMKCSYDYCHWLLLHEKGIHLIHHYLLSLVLVSFIAQTLCRTPLISTAPSTHQHSSTSSLTDFINQFFKLFLCLLSLDVSVQFSLPCSPFYACSSTEQLKNHLLFLHYLSLFSHKSFTFQQNFHLSTLSLLTKS